MKPNQNMTPPQNQSNLSNILDKQSKMFVELEQRQSQIEQRSKELDIKIAEEPELNKRIEVLNQQIAAKQSMLDNLTKQITSQQGKLDFATHQFSKQAGDYDIQIANKRSDIAKLNDKIANLGLFMGEQQTEKDRLQAEIKELKVYLDQQENIVNDTIAEWNAQLSGFQAEADQIDTNKRKLLADNVRLEQELTQLREDRSNAEAGLSNIQDQYNESELQHQSKLTSLQIDIDNKHVELSELDTKMEATRRGIQAKLKELEVREIHLNKKDNELSQKERYIESRLQLI